jgi:hypothetical protein
VHFERRPEMAQQTKTFFDQYRRHLLLDNGLSQGLPLSQDCSSIIYLLLEFPGGGQRIGYRRIGKEGADPPF